MNSRGEMILPQTEPQVGASGQAELAVQLVFGQSTVTTSIASSPMKLLTPISRGQSVWACTSSFGGGLVAGDRTTLRLSLGVGSRCCFGTQSSTKVYRNPARIPCSHRTVALLRSGSLLVFAPEPVQSFADSHYVQRQEFHLDAGAALVLVDWFSSGRAARGERWAFSHFESRNDVFLEGQRTFVDAIRLDHEGIGERMGRWNCLAALIFIGADLKPIAERMHAEMSGRPVAQRPEMVCSASIINNGVVLRIAGEQVESVRQELRRHLNAVADLVGDDPWSRKW